jgi:hypothetical protein
MKKQTWTEIRVLFCVVAYNAEKWLALFATTWNTFLRCGQQRGKIFGIVGNNADELPQRRTHFFVSLSLPLKRLFRIPVRECARTLWMGSPFWRGGGQIPKAGTRSISWAQIREEYRRDRMGRRQEVKEDDPFMASRCQHAQSKLMCIA